MPQPSCIITVSFTSEYAPNFTYLCVNQPPAWTISTDGNINPSSRSRIIELDLESHPPGGTYHGIKLSKTPEGLKSKDPHFNDTSIVVSQPNPVTIILDDDASPSGYRVWFALGVESNGNIYWDDPKIYNPPEGSTILP